MSLDPDVLSLLRSMRRADAARLLLVGAHGPLAGTGAAFGPHIAHAAYFAWLAYGHARHGMLSGRPSWEAMGTFASRVRTAASRSSSLAEWGSELRRSLRLKPEAIRSEDALWWREVVADAGLWPLLRRREALEEVIVAVGLLPDWMGSLKQTEGEEANA